MNHKEVQTRPKMEEEDCLLPPLPSNHHYHHHHHHKSHQHGHNHHRNSPSSVSNYSSLSPQNNGHHDNENINNRTDQSKKEDITDSPVFHHNDDLKYPKNDTSFSSNKKNVVIIMPFWNIVCILSTAFSYGCILTTLFLITLPMECQRIHIQHSTVPKSVALGAFVAIAGVTQLISPLVGHLSDTYIPPVPHELGQRLPYLVLGSICTVTGLLGQYLSSYAGFWVRYSFAFFIHMIGLNIMYAMMLALIPDQVPASQTGTANGVLALLLVTGSLFGFGLFHSPYFLAGDIHSMYGLYTCIVIVSSILTGTHAHDKDAELTFQRTQRRQRIRESKRLNNNDNLQNSPTAATVVTDDAGVSILVPPPSSLSSSSADAAAADKIIIASPSQRHKYKRQWHRVAHKVAKNAATKAKEIVLTPTIILRTMLVDPLRVMNGKTLWKSYTIDTTKHWDFFIVTISRLFYYCGMSVQTFFLYYVHDIIGIMDNPQATVATLAILGQFSGALTCYPVGFLSDQCMHKQRKPFVYLACAILSSAMAGLLFARTLHQMVIICLILGGANGIYLTMDTSLAVDTLPRDDVDDDDDDDDSDDDDDINDDDDDRVDDNDDDDDDESDDDESPSGSAQLLGIWGVAAFLGSALGPMIGGPLLYIFGSQQNNDSSNSDAAAAAGQTDTTTATAATTTSDAAEEYSMRGYAVVIGLASFYFFCSAVTLRFTKNI
jgi:MFS family permease